MKVSDPEFFESSLTAAGEIAVYFSKVDCKDVPLEDRQLLIELLATKAVQAGSHPRFTQIGLKALGFDHVSDNCRHTTYYPGESPFAHKQAAFFFDLIEKAACELE
ncbi:MAG: hypothetical protein ABII21_01870 [bacterium]